jgi:Acetyltransferases
MNKVRRAEIGDIPAILELLVQVDMVHHNGRPDLFRGPATKYNAEELKEIIANEKTPVFVCVNDEGKVLGHLFGMFKQELNDSVQTDIKTLYIDDICVDEAARGQGVGRTLYEYIKGFAKNEGCYNITLNVWCCNPDAMKFYENMGLVPQKIGMEHILDE